MHCRSSIPLGSTFIANFVHLVMFFKKRRKVEQLINSKFKVNDFVDFYYRDDVYFGKISKVYLAPSGEVLYDIDIAGQCPATLIEIEEKNVIRIHR